MSTACEVRSGARSPDPVRRLARRAGVGVLTAVMATGAALPLVATPASASLTGPGVDPGQNITVFANIDMVAVVGFGPVGSLVTVDVYRGDAKIGTASGPARDNGDGPGLEINHGVDGTALPGDCWNGAAPNISPGDRIVVTHLGDVDEVTVDDIHYTGRPTMDGPDVVVHGVALRAGGTPIPASFLDSAEFRSDSGKYRTTPVVEDRAAAPGGFTLRYSYPYLAGGRNRDGLSEEQMRQALLSQDGHAIGFGHTDPLPLEAMLVDGLTDSPGHAAGCGGSPADPTPPPPPFTTPDPGTPPPPPPGTNPGPGPVQPAPTTRTVRLNAVADTTARQSAPTRNYGSAKLLMVDTKATSSSKSRDTSYLKFKIPALAAGEKITGARLSLQVTNSTNNGPKVWRTGTGWRESTLTWKNQPGRVSSTTSGNFPSMAKGKRSTIVLTSLAGLGASRTVSFQLDAESHDDLVFASRETSTRPQLTLIIRKG